MKKKIEKVERNECSSSSRTNIWMLCTNCWQTFVILQNNLWSDGTSTTRTWQTSVNIIKEILYVNRLHFGPLSMMTMKDRERSRVCTAESADWSSTEVHLILVLSFHFRKTRLAHTSIHKFSIFRMQLEA